jgi:ferredoxin like protein
MPSARDTSATAKLERIVFHADDAPHVVIDQSICEKCSIDRICVTICPIQNYNWDAIGTHLSVSTESCMECGSCRIVCTEGAITWNWPRGGYGVMYVAG